MNLFASRAVSIKKIVLQIAQGKNKEKKCRIRETLNLSTDADKTTDNIYIIYFLHGQKKIQKVFKKKWGGGQILIFLFLWSKKKFFAVENNFL